MNAKIIQLNNGLTPDRSKLHNDRDMSFATVLAANADQLHADRRRFRHAPESAIVLNCQIGKSAVDLFLFKTRWMKSNRVVVAATPVSRNAKALAAYIAATGRDVTPIILKRGLYIAAIDGISADRQRVVEVLIHDDEDYDQIDLREKMEAGLLPEHDVIRLQHKVAVADAQYADLWLYNEKAGKGLLAPFTRNIGYFARIFTAWECFQRCVDEEKWLLDD